MATKNSPSQISPIYRIPPFHYIHVLDQNTGVTRLEIGPKNFFKQDNETITNGPTRMISIPPRHYCIIENPVVRNERGELQFDNHGQVRLSHADLEVRLDQDYKDPFPLYPGEILKQDVTTLKFIPANVALRLKALLDFDDDEQRRKAGDQWLFKGPGTYIPRKEISIEEQFNATVINPNQAIKLVAKKDMIDHMGKQRVTGEQWLIKESGAYLTLAYETVVTIENAHVLNDTIALHLRALKTFIDDFGHSRNNGDEWLVTREQTEAHILNVYEELVSVVKITLLNSRQYCIILNPVEDGKNLWGKKKLVVGEKAFFLQPNEQLEKGIQEIIVLDDNEGLLLKCIEPFEDQIAKTNRTPGEKWILKGPREYIPPVEVEILCRRKTIPLDEHEGIYVRDMKTGRVRAVIGEIYLLQPDEELWLKELPPKIEQFIMKDLLGERQSKSKETSAVKREKWRVVSYRLSQYEAVQIYDYKIKQSRIVFGPELVMLGPDEEFTLINLRESNVIGLFLFCLLWLNSIVLRITQSKYGTYGAIMLLVSYILYRIFLK